MHMCCTLKLTLDCSWFMKILFCARSTDANFALVFLLPVTHFSSFLTFFLPLSLSSVFQILPLLYCSISFPFLPIFPFISLAFLSCPFFFFSFHFSSSPVLSICFFFLCLYIFPFGSLFPVFTSFLSLPVSISSGSSLPACRIFI